MDNLSERITMDTDATCVPYTRLTIEAIIDLIASGVSIEEIISDYPEQEKEDIMASFAFAKTNLW
jgi:uncharacterized protein (DUF433 family)